MRLNFDPRLEFFSDTIRRATAPPDKLGELRASRDEAEASVSPANDRNYFRARAEEHSRLAAEARNPAARAAHLEFVDRYHERSLAPDDGSWVNEGGSWQ